MIKELKLPKLKPDMEKAVLCAWLKEEGEQFKAGDVLYEIETDKVVNQIEALEDGKILSLNVDEGDEVAVDTVVASYEV